MEPSMLLLFLLFNGSLQKAFSQLLSFIWQGPLGLGMVIMVPFAFWSLFLCLNLVLALAIGLNIVVVWYMYTYVYSIWSYGLSCWQNWLFILNIYISLRKLPGGVKLCIKPYLFFFLSFFIFVKFILSNFIFSFC